MNHVLLTYIYLLNYSFLKWKLSFLNHETFFKSCRRFTKDEICEACGANTDCEVGPDDRPICRCKQGKDVKFKIPINHAG